MRYDGLTETEAKAVASDILKNTVERHIDGGKRYGLKSIRNTLLEEIHFFTDGIENESKEN